MVPGATISNTVLCITEENELDHFFGALRGDSTTKCGLRSHRCRQARTRPAETRCTRSSLCWWAAEASASRGSRLFFIRSREDTRPSGCSSRLGHSDMGSARTSGLRYACSYSQPCMCVCAWSIDMQLLLQQQYIRFECGKVFLGEWCPRLVLAGRKGQVPSFPLRDSSPCPVCCTLRLFCCNGFEL